MKVIGIGLPKTGTTTLGKCLNILGFVRQTSWTREVATYYENRNIDVLMAYAESFDSFEDYPWCFLYKEFDETFPGSKFVYTVRKDLHIWLESRRKHSFVCDNIVEDAKSYY